MITASINGHKNMNEEREMNRESGATGGMINRVPTGRVNMMSRI